MNYFMSRRFAAAAMLAALLGPAGAVHAASSMCSVGLASPTCTTGAVRANSTVHSVHVSVTSSLDWKVTDVDTHVVVGRGTAGLIGAERTIVGLFGRYNASLTDPVAGAVVGGRITIRND